MRVHGHDMESPSTRLQRAEPLSCWRTQIMAKPLRQVDAAQHFKLLNRALDNHNRHLTVTDLTVSWLFFLVMPWLCLECVMLCLTLSN